MGKPGLFVERHLASDPSPGVLRPEPVARLLPRDLGGLVSGHDHESVDVLGVSALDHHRGVQDHDALEAGRPELGEPGSNPVPDRRVSERFESLPSGRISEDNGAEGFAVDPPVGPQDAATEGGDDLSVGGLAGLNHLPRQPVGVDDEAAERPEHRRDGALTGRDTPREADEQEAAASRAHPCACAGEPRRWAQMPRSASTGDGGGTVWNRHRRSGCSRIST